LLCVVLTSALALAQATTPERTVAGQTLRSVHTPAIQLTFNEVFKYAGGQRFILYNVADAEQHVFVDAMDGGRIRRMFWIQFEHYLPSNSETYRYKPNQTVRFGPAEFITDVRPFGSSEDPDSDGGHLKSMLEHKGLHWPVNAVRARFIHLANADRRSELMIIYVEDGKYAQVPPEDLANFESSQHWPQIEKLIVEHAQRLMRVGRK
jgi:hypothetical protein